MSKWDWGRIESLLEQIEANVQAARLVHQQATEEELPVEDLLHRAMQGIRDLASIKAMLQRERRNMA